MIMGEKVLDITKEGVEQFRDLHLDGWAGGFEIISTFELMMGSQD